MARTIRDAVGNPIVNAGIVLGAAAVGTIISWPVLREPARTGLDASWVVALHLAAWERLRHGVDVIFTYGPLGFLGFPEPYLGGTSVAALGFTAITTFALIALMIMLARQALPTVAAIIVALFVAQGFAPLSPWDLFQGIVLLAAALILFDARRGLNRERWRVSAAGAYGGLMAVGMLGKFNVGLLAFVTGVVVVLAVGHDRWRSATAMALVFVLATLALLVATGQQPLDYPLYLRQSLEIAAGYSVAHGMDFEGQLDWALSVGIALAVIIVGLLAWGTRDWSRQDRLLIVAITAISLFMTVKSGFVRDRYVYYFTILPPLAFTVFVGRARSAALAAVAAAVLVLLAALHQTPAAYLDITASVVAVRDEVAIALDPDRRRAAEEDTREQLRQQYGLDPEAEALLAGHTVHVEPWEAGIAAAYRSITWRPIPVFQLYSAYTRDLDRANAKFLRSDEAPERILRWTPTGPLASIDGRSYLFDSPEAKLEMLCRYVPLAAGAGWEVLGRVESRCGPIDWFAEVDPAVGETVTVPWRERPGAIIVASIDGLASTLGDRVEAVVMKNQPWWIVFDPAARFRLVPGTAIGPLLMGVPESIGAQFGMSGYVDHFSITDDAGTRNDPLVIRFGSIEVDPGESSTP
jgi:hypothetical protein